MCKLVEIVVLPAAFDNVYVKVTRCMIRDLAKGSTVFREGKKKDSNSFKISLWQSIIVFNQKVFFHVIKT